ncbi:putative disease resistance protein At3g14460 [Arachis hypogaea]|uniref:putative disease resistance protein At3g14460 n=1 Tax=Arachis hypogaea TaxID=3818 RepID=UPI000DECC8C3|nr:putative disease resistance protein At3g14460 [Arachis hypogaea]QHO55893.1 Putative disease resistance protein [Arachis hypogaea]
MGRALLSAFLHDLLDNFLFYFTSQTKPHRYLRKIKDKLLTLDALVDDAEQMQFSQGDKAQQVKVWLIELHHVVYHLEELLRQWQQVNTTTTKSLLLQLKVFSTAKRPDMDIKVQTRDAIESLEALVRKKDVLGLTGSATALKESLQGLASSSDVVHSYFYGKYPKDCFYERYEEVMSILKIMLSTSESENEEYVKVINIVGKPGAGKTTLTDVIYFNHDVRESFEPRARVSMHSEANFKFMAKKILEAVTEQFVSENDFSVLRKRLKRTFAGKKFLLVLDDIKIEDISYDWNMLLDSLESAARGSVIILISTPCDDEPNLFGPPASHTVHLDSLSMESAWGIFLGHASSGQMDLTEHEELAAAGKEIVNRLGNLPLAAKMIGSLFQDKLHLDQWVEILMSKFLHAGDVNISIPSFLVLCYLDLPAQIKRCFAYLSLFPKGYQFNKNKVVLLWMAEGFLKETNGKSMEDIGDEYFGYLIMRSFLEPYGSGGSFTMHNLVHDLATYVFGESYKHHLSYSGNTRDFGLSFLLKHGKSLRTILPIPLQFQRAPRRADLMLKVMMLNPDVLRVFSLSHYDITSLPTTIGKLIHLCFLDLSNTPLQTLPDSICELHNLQILLLTNCTKLTSLPKRICDLISLRYLDIRGSSVQEMPWEMHKLTSLRTLRDFIVSNTGPGLRDLAGLSNLKTLSISKLQNVASAKDASDCKLIEKRSLDNLMLQWNSGIPGYEEDETEVLQDLKPHKHLKKLSIEYYSGARFPNWLGDPSYQALQSVALRHCQNCTSLPTLGLLPLLKDLYIEGFSKVSSIGLEFYGEMTASQVPFQSLESLQFCDMLEWKKWNIPEGIEFPCLIKLCIIRCPKLVKGLPKQLDSLKKLEIFRCYDLVASLPKVSSTCELLVQECNETLMRNVAKSPSQASSRRVSFSEELDITRKSYSSFLDSHLVSEIEENSHEARMEIDSTGSRSPLGSSSSDTTWTPKLEETSSSMLSHQVEADIPKITQASTLPLTDTPTTVKEETFQKEDLDDGRSSFEIFKVSTVSQLKSLPLKLHTLKIEGCESLEALPDDLLGGITTLRELYLISCSSLRSLPSLGFVATLYIRNCRRLEDLSSLESRKQLDFLQHLFIGSSCNSLTTLTLDLLLELKILCVWDCPNLQSVNVTRDFKGDLASLESLEIRDCPRLRSFPDGGLHATNLESIFISNCKNLNKLPDAMNSLISLKTLFLHTCPEIESLPRGGLPPSLIVLSIAYCDKLIPQKDWRLDSLESLNRFELEGGCMGMDSFPEDNLLPCNINSLRISTMQSLKKLNHKGFQHLNALQTLEIHGCDVLQSLPDEGIPSSLSNLCVQECPLLTPRLKPKRGKEWHKVAHIPHIQIDYQLLSAH